MNVSSSELLLVSWRLIRLAVSDCCSFSMRSACSARASAHSARASAWAAFTSALRNRAFCSVNWAKSAPRSLHIADSANGAMLSLRGAADVSTMVTGLLAEQPSSSLMRFRSRAFS
eukprot:6198421-Pleurochrysis_carterae.AAC.3